jgi:hypothetical protein
MTWPITIHLDDDGRAWCGARSVTPAQLSKFLGPVTCQACRAAWLRTLAQMIKR